MAKKTATMPLGLLIETTRPAPFYGEHGYFHISARVVTFEDGNVRNGTTLYDPINGGLRRIEGLRAWSQGQNDERARGLYGFNVEFDSCSFIRRREAEAMFKTLDVIDKRLGKLYDTRGTARTYGEFVGRLAEAIGADTILFLVGKNTTWHSDNEYRRMEIGDGIRYVERLEKEWQNEGTSSEQAVSA